MFLTKLIAFFPDSCCRSELAYVAITMNLFSYFQRVFLAAHTVVLKGVHTFQNNMSVEYSDLDVMQMLGRAVCDSFSLLCGDHLLTSFRKGRPQFGKSSHDHRLPTLIRRSDKDGLAIIMCESELQEKYRALVQGKTVVESSLHLNLSEHLNSEIGLGTITNVNSAKEWLKSSFLFQRIQKNARHYALGKDEIITWMRSRILSDVLSIFLTSYRISWCRRSLL